MTFETAETLYNGSKKETGRFEYSPYGRALYANNADATPRGYTGHDWDADTALYFAPFRHYSPAMAKTQGSYAAAYEYRYDGRLHEVSTNFPGESSLTYEYGGDMKRRERTEGSDVTWYRWDLGWNVL